jgi:hypothetical protein
LNLGNRPLAAGENRLRARRSSVDHERMFRHAIFATPAAAGSSARAPMFATERFDGAER